MTVADDERLGPHPIGDVFPGVALAPLPDDCVLETLFVFSKLRFNDGTTAWQ